MLPGAFPCAPAVHVTNRGQTQSRHTELSACIRLRSKGRRERLNLNMQRKALQRVVAYYVSWIFNVRVYLSRVWESGLVGSHRRLEWRVSDVAFITLKLSLHKASALTWCPDSAARDQLPCPVPRWWSWPAAAWWWGWCTSLQLMCLLPPDWTPQLLSSLKGDMSEHALG